MPLLRPQLLEQHAAASEAYGTAPNRLFGDAGARLEILTEKPEHRLIIVLKSKGYSNAEIAQMTDFSKVQVASVLRQPWARMRLLDLIEKGGEDPLQALIKSSAIDNVETLIEVRDDPNAGATARINAANALLDRYLGRPLQKVQSESLNVNLSVNKIDEELVRLQAEESTLLGRSVPPASLASPGSGTATKDVQGANG